MVPMVGITMESIKRATVWEAVPELNSRTLFGRVVVNPPDRRAEVKAFPTLDTWYFCKCGKAFQNVERYKEHKNAGGGCQKKIQLQVKKSKKLKNITIAKTDDETYEIVDMPEKKLRRARISHENKGRVLKSRISNEPKARISYDQKSRIGNEQKSRIGNELKSRIVNEQKSRIGNEHMSRLLKGPKFRTPNNDHRLQIPHDRSQQKIGGIKLKNILTVTKPNREVPRMQGFIFRSNPTRSTVAAQKSQISERIDLFECRKCGKMFETLRTYRIHYTRMHVQVRTNTSPSVVLSGSPALKTVKQASRLTKTQDQLTSKTQIRQTFPGQKIGQKKAKGLKTKSMNMLMTKSGKVVGTKRCETCNLDFTHNVGYFMHMRCKHEGRGILKCENCTYKTLSQDAMEGHMKRFHRQRPTSFHLSLRSKDADSESPMSQNKEHLTDSGQNTVDNVEMADETMGISSRKIHQRNGARLPKCYWCKMRFQSTSELLVHSAFAHPHPRSQRKSSTVLSTPAEEADLSTQAEEAILSTPAEEVYLSTRAKKALLSKPANKAVLSKPAEEAVLSKPIEEASKSPERLPTSSSDSSTLKGRESIARRIIRCRHCSHRFENMTALDDHIKLAHPAKNLSTSKIVVSTRRIGKPIPAPNPPNEESAHVHGRSRRSVVRRRFASTSAGMHICTICRKRCRSSSQLRAHTRTHFEVSCEKCHWKFGCKKSLNRHLTNAHVPDGKFPCTLCSCSYRNNMGIASHMWHHHGMRGAPTSAEDKPEDPPMSTEVSLDDKNEIPTEPESHSDDPPTTSQDEVSRTSAAEKQKTRKKPEHIQNEPDIVKINSNMYNRCDACQQWIPQAQIDRHKRAAHEGGEFPCDKCSCVFRKLGSLVSHQNAMHRENTIKYSFFAEQLGEKTPGSPLRKPVEKSVKELPGTEESTNSISSKTAQEDVAKKRLSPLRSLICSVCKMRVSGGVRGMLQHKKTAHPHSGAYKFSTLKPNWAENLQDKRKAGGPISKANEERKDKETPSFIQNLRGRLEGNCKGSESAAVRFQDLAQNSLGSTPSKQTCETVPQIVNFFSQNANYVKQFSTTQPPPKIPSAFEKATLIFPRGVLKQKSGETEKSALNSLAKKITPKESLDVRPSEKSNKELIRRPVLTYMFGEERKEMSTRDSQSCIMKSRQNFPSSDNNIRKSQLLLLPPPTIEVSSSEFKLPRNLEKGAFKISNELTVSRVIPNLMPRNIHHQDASSVSNKQQQSRGLEFISGPISSVENDALKRLRGNPEVSIFPVAQKGMSQPMEATQSDQVLKPLAASSHVQCNIVPNAAKPRLGMCPKCKKSFFNRNRLTEHIDSCQVQPAAGMKCGYCGNNFSHDLLIAHMQECGRKQLA